MANVSSSDLSSILQSSDEEVVSVLGQGYLTSMLTGGGFRKCVLVLSNKRLYIKGRTLIDKNWINYDTCINVDKISSSSIRTASKVALYVSLSMGLILLLLGGIGGVATGELPSSGIIMLVLGALITFGSWAGIRFGGSRIFIVEYAGGSCGVLANWYPREEMEAFRRSLTHTIDY